MGDVHPTFIANLQIEPPDPSGRGNIVLAKEKNVNRKAVIEQMVENNVEAPTFVSKGKLKKRAIAVPEKPDLIIENEQGHQIRWYSTSRVGLPTTEGTTEEAIRGGIAEIKARRAAEQERWRVEAERRRAEEERQQQEWEAWKAQHPEAAKYRETLEDEDLDDLLDMVPSLRDKLDELRREAIEEALAEAVENYKEKQERWLRKMADDAELGIEDEASELREEAINALVEKYQKELEGKDDAELEAA